MTRRFVVELFAPSLAAIANPVVRDAYVQRLHELTGVDHLTILRAVYRAARRNDAALVLLDWFDR